MIPIRLFILVLLSFSFSCDAQLKASSCLDLDIERKDFSSTQLILFGETHEGRRYKKVLKEYIDLLSLQEIDTILLEIPYGVYLLEMLSKKGSKRNEISKIHSVGATIIPVDIEYDFLSVFLAIDLILDRNGLRHSPMNDLNSRMLDNFDRLDKDSIEAYIINLNSWNDKLEFFEEEFLELRDRINTTAIFFEGRSNLSKVSFRDSVMFDIVSTHIQNNGIEKWGGIFGYYHIAQEGDSVLNRDAEMQNNFISLITENDSLLGSRIFRFIYIDNEIYQSLESKNEESSERINKFFRRKKLTRYAIKSNLNSYTIYAK